MKGKEGDREEKNKRRVEKLYSVLYKKTFNKNFGKKSLRYIEKEDKLRVKFVLEKDILDTYYDNLKTTQVQPFERVWSH